MSAIRVLFADDRLYLDYEEDIEAIVKGAIRVIDSRLTVEYIPVERYSKLTEHLEDRENSIDIAILDVHWTLDGTTRQDCGDHLLRLALSRPETVTILMSSVPDVLLRYLYSASTSTGVPHAVINSRMLAPPNYSAAVLTSGFSAAGLPLRSRVVRINWEAPTGGVLYVDSLVQTAIQELALVRSKNAERVTFRLISGGLSGALTVAVEASRGKGAPRRFLLKSDRDIRVVAREVRAHELYREILPPNTFAPLLGGVESYAGVHSIALGLAAAQTVADAGAAILDQALWDRVFSVDLIDAVIEAGEFGPSFVSDLVSEVGLLRGNRFQRARSEMKRLDVDSTVSSFFERNVDSIFDSAGDRPLFRTIAHGDLHTRNVMMSVDGKVYWIDAASMEEGLPWAEDLARFSVWVACGFADDDPDRDVLAYSLFTQEERIGERLEPPEWAAALRIRIRESLKRYSAAFAEKKGATLNVQSGWQQCVATELLRAGYSTGWFGRATRRAALEAAYLSLNEVLPA